MFDIGATELLVIAVVAILVIGPKDMPLALRTAGRLVGKMRRLSHHFRSGVDAMIREAELEEMEKEWREQNKRIMAESNMPSVTAETRAEATPVTQDDSPADDSVEVKRAPPPDPAPVDPGARDTEPRS